MSRLRPFRRDLHRALSALFFHLVNVGTRVLPFGRYAAAAWLVRLAQPWLRPAVLRTQGGSWLVIPDAPITWVLPLGLKEPAVQHHLRRLLCDSDAFIDCGANVGWYSFLASRRSAVREILAVEPLPEPLRFLHFVRRLNHADRVQTIPACVSDRDGSVTLGLQRGRFAEMSRVLDEGGRPEDADAIETPSLTLELLCRKLSPGLSRICIKVDVEGHEAAVLDSISRDTLRRRVSAIIVEVHLYRFAQPGAELRRVWQALERVGPPECLLVSPEVTRGYQRLWWRLTGGWPLARMSRDDLANLVERRGLAELHLVARRPQASQC